jgi:hypothetical protein
MRCEGAKFCRSSAITIFQILTTQAPFSNTIEVTTLVEQSHTMASNPDTTVPTTMQPPQPVVGGFRLGEEHASDVSDSEDDQSVTSERGAKPPQQSQPLQALQASQAEDKSTRSSRRRKNKQTRHEIGALQNDLDIVLENAFSASAPESDIAPGT